MIIKPKLLFKIWAVIMVVVIVYEVPRKLLTDQPLTTQEWVLLVTLPLSVLLFVGIGQTIYYEFSPKGASVYFKIGLGRFKLWEQTNYHLKWHEVVRVYSVFPVWLPFHMIGVSGIQNGMQGRNFFIGSVTTKKKEALLYVADHVSPKVIDEEVQTLVKRYRAKARKKEKTSTPAN